MRNKQRRLEEFSDRKYPDYVKESLSKCGYDSIESLGMICVESVTDMEEYLKIKFLPAHKDFILDIADQIEEMTKRKKPQQSNKQKKKGFDNTSRSQRKKIDEKKVKCKSDSSTQGLKSGLVDKIRKYVKSNGLGYENMTNDNVIGFKRCSEADEKYLYECFFKCPFCEKTYSVKCMLTKNWDTRNIYKHLNEKHKVKPESGSTGVSSTKSTDYPTPTMHSTAEPINLSGVFKVQSD